VPHDDNVLGQNMFHTIKKKLSEKKLWFTFTPIPFRENVFGKHATLPVRSEVSLAATKPWRLQQGNV